MTTIHKATLVAVVLAAAPVFLGQAFAASGTHMGCNMTAMTKDGMLRIRFQNAGNPEILPARPLHWCCVGLLGRRHGQQFRPTGRNDDTRILMSDMANMSADVPCSV
jgi:hypothetical protein